MSLFCLFQFLCGCLALLYLHGASMVLFLMNPQKRTARLWVSQKFITTDLQSVCVAVMGILPAVSVGFFFSSRIKAVVFFCSRGADGCFQPQSGFRRKTADFLLSSWCSGRGGMGQYLAVPCACFFPFGGGVGGGLIFPGVHAAVARPVHPFFF